MSVSAAAKPCCRAVNCRPAQTILARASTLQRPWQVNTQLLPLRRMLATKEQPQNQPQKPTTRPFLSASPPSESGKSPQPKDFRGQLWDSVGSRIKRQDAEQEQYIAQRAALRQGGLGPATVAGVCFFNAPPRDESTLPLERSKPPQHDTALPTLQAAWVDLKNIVGEANISTDAEDVKSHAGSAWSSYPSNTDVAFAVVRPDSTEQVSEIMKVCHARRIPVTAYSGGTSLEGHFAATRGGICIDFGRMDKILTLHADDLDVVVQPAVGWEGLNEELAEHGLFFPPDPGPGAMIGGMIGTGCSGTNAFRYGTMRDWVVSLTVVLADGTVIKTRQRPRKSSAGYDLTRLFVGSEGTLGLVTEATLKVTAAPQNVRVAAAAFASTKDAAECVTRVVKAGIPIAAVELLDDAAMACINKAGVTQRRWAEKPTLFFKFSGPSPTLVDEGIAQVRKAAKASGMSDFNFARNSDEAAELWSARKDLLWSTMAAGRHPDTDKIWTTDVAVPLSALPTIVDETKRDLQAAGLIATIVGHVGDGNFHCIISYDADKERKTVEQVVHKMVERALALEGTTTGEHGVGLVKRDHLEHELGKDTVDAMRTIKRAFDPRCLLNCDKIVRVAA